MIDTLTNKELNYIEKSHEQLKTSLESYETLRKLLNLKEPYLKSKSFSNWIERTKNVRLRYLEMIKDTGFKNGNNFNEDNLRQLGKQLR